MRRVIRAALALGLLVFAVAQEDGEVNDFRRPTKITTNCCKSVSKAPIPYKIYEYQRQNALGPCVEAVIFYTDSGKICSDPQARWIPRKLKDTPMHA